MAGGITPNPIRYHIYHGQALPDPWPYDYVLDRAGVVKRSDQPGFSAAVRVAGGPGLVTISGLPEYPCGVELRLPRVPGRWLHSILDHAIEAGGQDRVARPVEQMYHLHYFTDGRGWQVAVPKQRASAGRVAYRGGDNAHVVAELHSHHYMDAYFSRTDDDDEQGCRFYAVIGRIYSQPEIRLRLGLYGDFAELDPLLLFEGLGPFRRVYL